MRGSTVFYFLVYLYRSISVQICWKSVVMKQKELYTNIIIVS